MCNGYKPIYQTICHLIGARPRWPPSLWPLGVPEITRVGSWPPKMSSAAPSSVLAYRGAGRVLDNRARGYSRKGGTGLGSSVLLLRRPVGSRDSSSCGARRLLAVRSWRGGAAYVCPSARVCGGCGWCGTITDKADKPYTSLACSQVPISLPSRSFLYFSMTSAASLTSRAISTIATFSMTTCG